MDREEQITRAIGKLKSDPSIYQYDFVEWIQAILQVEFLEALTIQAAAYTIFWNEKDAIFGVED